MTCVILLATKNGEKFLKEQLDSIQSQAYKDWIVYASDDSSKDNTLNILLSYQKKWGKKKLNIYKGPNQGHAKNFWSLIHRVKGKQIKYISFVIRMMFGKQNIYNAALIACEKTQKLHKLLVHVHNILIRKGGCLAFHLSF